MFPIVFDIVTAQCLEDKIRDRSSASNFRKHQTERNFHIIDDFLNVNFLNLFACHVMNDVWRFHRINVKIRKSLLHNRRSTYALFE